MRTTSDFDPERACIENAAWLRDLARALVADTHIAEDIVQDALGATVIRAPKARDVRAYLAGTVRFLASKSRREAGRRAARERDYGEGRATVESGADDVLERMDLMRRVLEEVESLPRTEGRVIGMRFVDGLAAEEIAERMGIAPSSVRSALSRGLARLRERFDRTQGGREAWAPTLVSMTGATASERIVDSTLRETHQVLVQSAASAAVPLVGVGTVMSMKWIGLAASGVVLAVLWIAARGDERDGTRAGSSPPASSDVRDDINLVTPEVTLAKVDTPGTHPERSTPVDALPASPPPKASTTPPSGQIGDALTGEVVPSMGLAVVSPKTGSTEPLRTRTDAVGSFRLDVTAVGDALNGPIELELRDGPQMQPDPSRRLNVELPTAAPIEVSVGPTFRFGPVTTSRLAMMHHARAYAIGPDVRKEGTRRVEIFRGEPAWVRLRDPLGIVDETGESETQGPWTLVVDAMGGLVRGTATIERAFGIEPLPLELDFVELGSIGFKLIQVEGESLAQDPQVEVVRASDGRVHHVQLLEFEEQWIGSLTGVDPGRYQWQLLFAGDARRGEVDVIAGKWSRVGIQAASAAGDGYELAIDTSRAMDVDLDDWTLHLIDVDRDTRHTSLTPERSESAPSTLWRASLGALPDGNWLGLLRPKDGYRVVPSIVEVGPNRPNARVTVEPVVTRTIELHVSDAETGRPIQTAIAMLVDGMDLHRLDRESEGRQITGSAPSDRDVTVLLRAPGFEMVDLRIARGHQDVERDVQLRPGWRNCVRVAQAATTEPVGGISVHVDGEFAGTTDADGVLWIVGAGPPGRIEVGLDDARWTTLFASSKWKGAVRPDPATGYLFLVKAAE